MNDSIFLHKLSNEQLLTIINLPEKVKTNYFDSLIERFYPVFAEDYDNYEMLLGAYDSSFNLEHLYRTNKFLKANYTAIYTNTGLIREFILDIYSIENNMLVLN